jgi:protein phosphatase
MIDILMVQCSFFGYNKNMGTIVCFGKSDVGLRRSNNEDAFFVAPDLGVCSVADGMGGAASGEIASRLFVETCREIFSPGRRQTEQEVLASVQQVFQTANGRILKQGTDNPHQEGMGCTAELIAFHDQTYVLGHVGDSRTYLFRQGKLRQMTKDHSLVQDQLDQGIITPVEARNHSLRHVLVRAVGVGDTLAVDLVKGGFLPGDVFLLCSDGLTDMVDDAALERVLSSDGSLEQRGERLIESAKSAGGYDNITILLCEVTA